MDTSKHSISISKKEIDKVSRVKKSLSKSDIRSGSSSILSWVLLFLLVCSLVSALTGVNSSNYTFTGFLNLLSQAPNIDMSWLSGLPSIPASLADIPFLGSFINFFYNIFRVLAYLACGIAQLATFLTFALGYIFGF